MATFYAAYSGINLPSGVSSLNALTGALTLVAGSNITITPSGSNITIAATGGSSSSGVAGSVQFSDGAGGFNSDGTKFFWDNSTKRLGIGTATPVSNVHVVSAAASAVDHGFVQENNSNNAFSGTFQGKKSRGTYASPTAALVNDVLASFSGFGYGTTGYSTIAGSVMSLVAAETQTDTAHGSTVRFSTTAIGSVTSHTAMLIGTDSKLSIFNSAGSHSIGLVATAGTDYSITLPTADGTAGQLLTTDGSSNWSWVSGASGSFTTADAKTVTVVNGLITSIV